MSVEAVEELVSATRVFVSRHEEALRAAEPRRVAEACEGLHHGLCATLAQEAARLRGALPGAREAPGAGAPLVEGFARYRAGDPLEREAWAFASLAKRLSEAEGLLLHLRLSVLKGSDGPAAFAHMRRVAGESVAASRALAALLRALDAWGHAYAHAEGAPAREAPHADPRESLRAARECLLSGAPEGVAPLLRSALVAALQQPLGKTGARELPHLLSAWGELGEAGPVDPLATRMLAEALHAGTHDPVLAWRLLDLTEALLNRLSMTRVPDEARARVLARLRA